MSRDIVDWGSVPVVWAGTKITVQSTIASAVKKGLMTPGPRTLVSELPDLIKKWFNTVQVGEIFSMQDLLDWMDKEVGLHNVNHIALGSVYSGGLSSMPKKPYPGPKKRSKYKLFVKL
jgi:hypothetical protein